MNTLLIYGESQPPESLREILRKGSTAVDEISTTELSTFVSREGFGVDRVVVWAAPDDQAVRALATNYAISEEERRGVIYITPAGCGGRPAGVALDRFHPVSQSVSTTKSRNCWIGFNASLRKATDASR